MEVVRVELELRISDEVMVRGYETPLMLSGAPSLTISTPHGEASGGNAHIGSLADVEAQIMTFIDGTDPTISRAMRSFARKVGGAEHGVMIVKKVIHDPQSILSTPVTTTEHTPPSDPMEVRRQSMTLALALVMDVMDSNTNILTSNLYTGNTDTDIWKCHDEPEQTLLCNMTYASTLGLSFDSSVLCQHIAIEQHRYR